MNRKIKITAKTKTPAFFLPPCCIVGNIEVGLEGVVLKKKYNIKPIATVIMDKSIKE